MEKNKNENLAANNSKTEIEENKKEPMNTKQKVFFVLKIVGNVLFYGILVLLFLFAIFNINGGNGTDNFPNIFGTGFLSVQSDSMKRSSNLKNLDEWDDYEIGGFEKGDLLKDSVFHTEDANELKIGMVITFYDASLKGLNTHRIVYVHEKSDGNVDYVITQGDARAQIQAYVLPGTKRAEGMSDSEIASYDYQLESTGAIENVEITNIRGIVKSVSVGGGKVLDNIRQNYLFYFVLPVAVLLLFEIFLVVRNIMILRGEKNKAELEGTREAMMADVEAEKEKMRQELLAEMRAQGLVLEDTNNEEVKEENKVDESTEDKKEEVVETETTAEVVEETNAEEVKEESSNEETTTESVEEEKKEETEEETASEE